MKLRKYFSIEQGSRFKKNLFKVARANLIAQSLPILSTPLLTRLYSANDFGVVTLLFTTLSFLLTFSTWRVEWSIPNSRSNREESNLILIGFFFLFTSCILLTLLGFSHYISLFDYKRISAFLPYLHLILFALTGESIIQLAISTHIRAADMGPVSKAAIVRAITTTIVSLYLGYAGAGEIGLVVGNIAGIWLSATSLYCNTTRSHFNAGAFDLQEAISTWKRYKSECSTSVVVSLINYGFLKVLPLSLITVYSVKEVGYYALASKLATVPIRLISQAVAQSFWAESSQLVKQDPARLRSFYKKTLLRLCVFSILPALMCLCGPLYVGFIFGKEEWTQAGTMLAAITPQTVGTIIIGSTNHLTVYNKQKYQLISDIATILNTLIWLIIVKLLNIGFFVAILGISSITLLGYIFRFFLHLKANKEYINEL